MFSNEMMIAPKKSINQIEEKMEINGKFNGNQNTLIFDEIFHLKTYHLEECNKLHRMIRITCLMQITNVSTFSRFSSTALHFLSSEYRPCSI